MEYKTELTELFKPINLNLSITEFLVSDIKYKKELDINLEIINEREYFQSKRYTKNKRKRK